MNLIPILSGKSISILSKLYGRNGSTWPGHIALKLNSNILTELLKKNPNLKIVLVAGTNGKTTTSKLIYEVLEKENHKVFRNQEGANLLNGIVSSLISHSNTSGKINYNTAIFEIDENSLPIVLSELSNTNNQLSIILLNLFRDQLDRYGEVNTIANKWQEALEKLPKKTILVSNGDDPMLSFLGESSKLQTYYFGLPEKEMEKKEASHDVDFLYCPNCKTKLNFDVRSYSHMGKFNCPNCKFTNPKTETFDNLKSPLLGIYNSYNINAAAILLQKVFNVNLKTISNVLEIFSPAFGRQERISYKGKNIFLMLSKNPASFNQSIQAILGKEKNPNVLLVLNDRIPDGTDVSWIWDIDTEELVKKSKRITVSGDRTYDMALRIKYSDSSNFEAENDLKKAIDISSNKLNKNETLYILATYSAMLETRRILTGKKIL